MKNIFCLSLLFVFSTSAFACLDQGSKKSICPKDTVYTQEFNMGATVLGINPRSSQVLLRSDYSGETRSYDRNKIFLTKGCQKGVCVNKTVFTLNFNLGATVLALNPYSSEFLVQSGYSKEVKSHVASEIFLIKSCVMGICGGDEVYTEMFNLGAKVIAVNPMAKKIMVKSSYSGEVKVYSPRELTVTDFCLGYDSERNNY